jgi:hypothetical protein
MLHRSDLQLLAQAKLDDAELLFQHQRFSNAYYLFGYAAEIAIKARISRIFMPETIPDRRLVNDVYSHDLGKLIGLAGLAVELDKRRKVSAVFEGHWSAVSTWSEQTRYDMIDAFTATALRNAMMDENEGVFGWLQNFW